MNVYSVGAGSDECKIEAPSAEVAAFFYFVKRANLNLPIMAVYTENGKEYEGEQWWIGMSLCGFKPGDDEFLKAKIPEIREQFDQCRFVVPGETSVSPDDLVSTNLV